MSESRSGTGPGCQRALPAPSWAAVGCLCPLECTDCSPKLHGMVNKVGFWEGTVMGDQARS